MPKKGERRPVAERFYEKVVAGPGGCHVWVAHRNWAGYGVFWSEQDRLELAHRVASRLYYGPDSLIEGLQIDHLCCVKWCVNPLHMEQVTHRTNSLRGGSISAQNYRKTHCAQGHEFTEENTMVTPVKNSSRRRCRACLKIGNTVRAAARKELRRQAKELAQ